MHYTLAVEMATHFFLIQTNNVQFLCVKILFQIIKMFDYPTG